MVAIRKLRFDPLLLKHSGVSVRKVENLAHFAFAVSPLLRGIDLAISSKMGPMNPPFVGKRQFERRLKSRGRPFILFAQIPVCCFEMT